MICYVINKNNNQEQQERESKYLDDDEDVWNKYDHSSNRRNSVVVLYMFIGFGEVDGRRLYTYNSRN